MNNFWRAFRLALRYRLTLVGIVVSSLAIAIFWGGNLGTVYPIVDIVLKDRSLRTWIDENIETGTRDIAGWQQEIAEINADLAAGATRDQTNRLSYLASRVEAEEKVVRTARRWQPWVNQYTPAKPFTTLVMVIILLFVGTLFKSLFLVLNVILVRRISLWVAFDLRKLLYRRTLRMNLNDFGEDRVSTLMSHFTHEMDCLTRGVETVFGRAVREPLKIIACLLGAAWICWPLLVLSLVVTPIAIYGINRLATYIKRASSKAMEGMAEIYSRLHESLTSIELVKAYTTERSERRRFHHSAKNYARRALRIAVFQALSKPLNELMSIGVVAFALLTGGYLVLNQETHLFGLQITQRPLNFGALMTFFALLAGISDPFRKLIDVYNEIQRGAAAADRVFTLIDREPEIQDPVSPRTLTVPLQRIQFDNVTFGYLKNRPVLNRLSLEIAAGETVAIVGPNGAGKSTLAKLVLRFIDPEQGAVLWNGTDLRELRRRDLRRQLAMVNQRTLILDDTVLYNIRYGSPQATPDQVEAAARQAHAHEFIQRLPDGYDTPVGAGGNRLSGGQRQRVAMARALLRNPEVLILDEATSQVDLESEQLIREALAGFASTRTAIIITHRLETLSLCDRIIVLDEGEVADEGTHHELLGRCPLYCRLHQLQFKVPA